MSASAPSRRCRGGHRRRQPGRRCGRSVRRLFADDCGSWVSFAATIGRRWNEVVPVLLAQNTQYGEEAMSSSWPDGTRDDRKPTRRWRSNRRRGRSAVTGYFREVLSPRFAINRCLLSKPFPPLGLFRAAAVAAADSTHPAVKANTFVPKPGSCACCPASVSVRRRNIALSLSLPAVLHLSFEVQLRGPGQHRRARRDAPERGFGRRRRLLGPKRDPSGRGRRAPEQFGVLESAPV